MEYVFSEDWFSPRIENFSTYLRSLEGTPCHLLEVGTFEGRSTFWLLDNVATHPRAKIDTIDIEEHPNFSTNIARCPSREKLRFHRGRSFDHLRAMAGADYDFIYVDGCHWTVNVLEDAVLGFRCVKAGGIMAFDDYLWDNENYNQEGIPKPAIDAFLEIYKSKIEPLHIGYQVWVRRKAD